MAAKDYKIFPTMLNAYIVKVSKKYPNIVLSDRREITDDEIINLICWRLEKHCCEDRTDTMFVSNEKGQLFELKAKGTLLDSISKALGVDAKILRKHEKGDWSSAHEIRPKVNREVIAITKDKKICFAHIVDDDNNVNYNGWNIPGVEFWKPCNFSDEMEEFYNNTKSN